MWPEAIDRIQQGAPAPSFDHRRFAVRGRRHVVITGNSGSGKTRLWSTLTKSSAPEQMSLTHDDGYMITYKKRSLVLITVPGQYSSPRFVTLERLFDTRAHLQGIMFVACAGYDHIWPANADIVANELRRRGSYNIDGLRRHNLDNEQESFKDICRRIAEKTELTRDRDLWPKWLVVAVNKADLYWGQLPAVHDYYLPGSGSPFDRHREALFDRIGHNTIRYLLLPLITAIGDYRFQPSSAAIPAPVHPSITPAYQHASLECLASNLEELYAEFNTRT